MKNRARKGPDLYRVLFEKAPICIHELDLAGRYRSVNRVGLDFVGETSDAEVRGRSYLDFVSRGDRDRVRRLLEDALAGTPSEFELSSSSEERRRHFASCFIPCPSESGQVERIIGISADITERKESEAELRRLNRTLTALSRCKDSLARAVDEEELLQAFCRNAVEMGHYSFAWVGYREPDAAIRLVAHASHGDSTGCASEVAILAASQVIHKCCRDAIDRNSYVLLPPDEGSAALADRSSPTDEDFVAGSIHCRSMIVLPLVTDRGTLGCFNIASTDHRLRNKQEIALLAELAEDLSKGIATARLRAARAREIQRLREDAEESERRRIAEFLHDRIGQSMQAANLGMKHLRAALARERAGYGDLLDQIIDEIAQVISQVRACSQELSPLFLDKLALGDAIGICCAELGGRAGVQVDLVADWDGVGLDERTKKLSFLAFREAITNAIKHAQATRIEVWLQSCGDARFQLRIADNGLGFEVRRVQQGTTSLGLALLRERIMSLAGESRIASAPGAGTVVDLWIPILGRAPGCQSASS